MYRLRIRQIKLLVKINCSAKIIEKLMNCVKFTQKTLDFFLQTFYNNENIGADMKKSSPGIKKIKIYQEDTYYGRL